jgi:hypothetical protein
VGLHFAVMAAGPSIKRLKSGKRAVTFTENAAVWVLNPVAWNQRSLSHLRFKRGVLTPAEDAIKGYQPLTPFSEMNNHPVALYGAHNSPRIVAQRGVFTIFGQDTTPMEAVYAKDSFPDNCLIRVDLPHARLPRIRRSILGNGVTESVVFPDLDGLAREIKRDFGFDY